MNNVQFTINNHGLGAFYVEDNGKTIAFMDVLVKDNVLKAIHTEVLPEGEGKGLAKDLLNAMVNHARANNLQVVPLCLYVHGQFAKHPELYNDIWKKD
jgi:hypothetical protein